MASIIKGSLGDVTSAIGSAATCDGLSTLIADFAVGMPNTSTAPRTASGITTAGGGLRRPPNNSSSRGQLRAQSSPILLDEHEAVEKVPLLGSTLR
ncbi:MAG: hypothetical protein QFC78_11690 [Pseudomonadota bacterium]|nr:hypothetical protein [Pseudomonadota bacterium]